MNFFILFRTILRDIKMITTRVPQDLLKELTTSVVQRFHIAIDASTFFFDEEVNIPRNFSQFSSSFQPPKYLCYLHAYRSIAIELWIISIFILILLYIFVSDQAASLYI